jgi:hypothetical protein
MTIEDTVTQIVALCREESDGYRHAAENLVEHPEIAHFFDQQADYRDQIADRLEKQLVDSGKRLNPKILTAPPSEGWTRPAPDESNPKLVIEACHESQERTVHAFDSALKSLPDEWRWLLSEYSQNLHSALSKLHSWMQGKEVGPDFR